jgi:cytochrome c oxidase subunit III
MSPESSLLTPEEHDEFEQTVMVRHRLEEQYRDLEQQSETAALGMWVFLGTEVLFFGTLFLGLGAYMYQHSEAFEKASQHLNWPLGGINMAVLVSSSLMMALAVHYAQLGQRRSVVFFLGLTALLGLTFLVLKGTEYYLDLQEKLVPGLSFEPEEWRQEGVNPDHVQLFLLFYWIMTGTHALHVTIGVGAVLTIAVLARQGRFSPVYYSPVDVTGLYWHFVDIVWIFLYPMLYLSCTHTVHDLHF